MDHDEYLKTKTEDKYNEHTLGHDLQQVKSVPSLGASRALQHLHVLSNLFAEQNQ